MAVIVQKYGGTSVGTTERIEQVAEKIMHARANGDQLIVVVSAMSGETNRLLGLATDIMGDAPYGPELDVLLSTGEQVTIALLAMALNQRGCKAVARTGWQLEIKTDAASNKARIESINTHLIQKDLDDGAVIVVAGFQGINQNGAITTLGRGGSDTTAVALATAIEAQECQIYTDVDGVYTTDPRVEPNARRLQQITFEEMLEMASLGSKVLQIRAVEFAGKYKVPLRVLSTFKEGPGTLITTEENQMEEAKIAGIAFNRDEAQLTLKGVPDQPGIAAKILGPISRANIEIDMIVQNVAWDNTANFTFTVHRNDYKRALKILQETGDKLGANTASGDDNIVKLSIVGVGMRSHAGIASEMFEALAEEGINIRMISTSEIKISVVVDEKYLELGVRCLHDVFGLSEKQPSAS
jgi:aspartate kinase